VFNDWASRILRDLGSTCRRWVASFVSHVNEAERVNVVEGLDEISTEDSIEEATAEEYAEFLSALDTEGLQTEEVSDHLGRVAQRVADLTYTQAQGSQFGSAGTVSRAENYLAYVLPALATLLSYVPADNVGAMLTRAFVDGWYIDHAHPLFAQLHATMVDRWPSTDDVPYTSEAVFERAEGVAKRSPELDEAPGLVRSMASVAAADQLGANFSRRVLDAACALWPYHQEFVLETITSTKSLPNPDSLASLAAETNPDDAEEFSRLEAAWQHCASLLSGDEVVQVTGTLLEQARDEEAGDPDWALGLWLRAAPEAADVLRQQFENSDLADEDLERLWVRAAGDAERLGPTFFRSALPILFGREGVERTISAVKSNRDEVTALFVGPSAQNELGRVTARGVSRL
jgi:hypothetical protein